MTKVKLSDVVRRCQTKVNRYDTDLTYFVAGEHFDSGEMELNGRGEVAGSTIGPMFYYGFKPGDFLLVSRNPHLKKASRVEFAGICSEKTFVLESADENVLLSEYLPWVLQNDSFWDYAQKNRHGSTNSFINWSTLADYEFDLPKVGDQARMSELLWAAQDLRRNYRSLLVACDDVVKSQFVEMFGRLNSTDLKPLKDVCSIITDGTHQPSKFVDRGIPFLFVSNITSDTVNYDTNKFISVEDYEQLIRRTPIEVGDVLVSAVGSFGHPAIVEDDRPFCFQRHIAYLKPRHDLIDSNYLHAALLSEDAQRYMDRCAKGAAQRTVTLKSFKEMKVPVPPFSLQQEFADFAASVDKSKFAVQKALDELNATTKKILNQELGLGDV